MARKTKKPRKNPVVGLHRDLFGGSTGVHVDWKQLSPEEFVEALKLELTSPEEWGRIRDEMKMIVDDAYVGEGGFDNRSVYGKHDLEVFEKHGVSEDLARAILDDDLIEKVAAEVVEKVECDFCNESFPENETVEAFRYDSGDAESVRCCEACQNENATKCQSCRDWTSNEDLAEIHCGSRRVESWCPSCRENDSITCERCHELWREGYATTVHRHGRRRESETWCDECAGSNAYKCQRCDDYYSDESGSYEVGGDSWCPSCAESYSCSCEDCDETYDCDYNHDCPNRRDDDPEGIGDYGDTGRRGFTPIDSPWTQRQPKKLYFGVELEVEADENDDRGELAAQVRSSMGHIVAGIDKDGSLDYGFEIITQPAGLDTHREHWSKADLSGLKSHDTSTCGLHVHMTRRAISQLTMGKMLEFTYSDHNKTFMEVFTRRGFVGYALRVAGLKISKAVKPRPERYEAWNTQNAKTIEFRMPKGTTRKTTILATLEFCYALIRFCERASNVQLTHENFKKMIAHDAWLKETRFLRAYLVDRGLASAKEMRLPKLKPGATPPLPLPGDASPRENPTSWRPQSYAEAALNEFEAYGEDGPVKTDAGLVR